MSRPSPYWWEHLERKRARRIDKFVGRVVSSRSSVWLCCGQDHAHEPYKAYVVVGRSAYRVDDNILPVRYREDDIDAYVATPKLRVTKVSVDPSSPRCIVGLRVTMPKRALSALVQALSAG